MNIEQFRVLERTTSATSIDVSALSDRSDRTLIYGFTTNRHDFHLYLKDGLFVGLIADADGVLLQSWSGESIELEQTVPDKRVYPESSDFEFCAAISKLGVTIPFTTFTERGCTSNLFHGLLLEKTLPTSLAEKTRFVMNVRAEDVGVNSPDNEHCISEMLSTLVSGQASGFLRSVMVRGKTVEESHKWIDNIAWGIENSVSSIDKTLVCQIDIQKVDQLIEGIKLQLAERILEQQLSA